MLSAQKTQIDSATTATNPSHSDTYIVEYPKSGITWLGCILANMFLRHSTVSARANTFNLNIYIPDIHVTRDIGPSAFLQPATRFIKSHAPRNDNYNNVIYLVRHPVAVLVSYYKYSQSKGQFLDNSFEQFVKSKTHGAEAWASHVESWLSGPEMGKIIYLVRYEDLVKNTEQEMQEMNVAFGWGVSDECLNAAVSESTVKPMQQAEEMRRKRNPRYRGKFVKNSAEIAVSAELRAYIESVCSKALLLAGYDD